MKKLLVSMLAVGAMLTAGAYAADLGSEDLKINFYASDVSENAFDIVANIKSNSPCYTFKETVTFKTDMFVLANFDYEPLDFSEETADDTFFPLEYKVGKKTYSYSAAASEVKDNGDGTVTVDIDLYTTDSDKFPYEDFDIVSFAVVLAPGKTVADIKDGDLVVDQVVCKNGVAQYSKNASYDPADSAIEYTNSICREIPIPPVHKLEIITDKSFVGIRSDSAETTGVRFKASTLTTNKALASEYGFLVAIESTKSGLKGTEYELDFDLDATKYVKGVAYDSKTDIFWGTEDLNTIITAVVTGMPLNKTAVTTMINVRPYIKDADGNPYYGEAVKDCAANIANVIKNTNPELYAANKAYIDAILALVPADTDLAIDIGDLFD